MEKEDLDLVSVWGMKEGGREGDREGGGWGIRQCECVEDEGGREVGGLDSVNSVWG